MRDQAVCERDRFVFEVDAAALEGEAGGAGERVASDAAVLEDEWPAEGWAVGPEGESDVRDAGA